MNIRPISCVLLILSLGTTAILAVSGVADDPSQWTGHDVYAILHNSPWSRNVKMKFPTTSWSGADTPGGNSNANNVPMPMGGSGGGRMNRRGTTGGSRAGGSYGSGGGANSGGASKAGPTEVIVQWQSALVVRMAAAKQAEAPLDASVLKVPDQYVIAVIGLPITAVGGRAASADSDKTVGPDDEQRLEERLKASASILRGHSSLAATKVELDQGRDGRMLIYFPKSDPITAEDKSVEFRLAASRPEIRRKFLLKDMEYKGKLEL